MDSTRLEFPPEGVDDDTRLSTMPSGRASRRRRWQLLWAAVASAVIALAWFVPWVFLLKTDKITVQRRDSVRGFETHEVGPAVKGWVRLPDVSRHLTHAIVTAEDARFYQHAGLDFAEIEKSLAANRRKKRYARGASTITQQVVKMAFLSPEKTLIRKAREATGALLLSVVLSKEDILEWYVNLAEFGGGIYGIRAAARAYYRAEPKWLTIEQSIHLAVLLPRPTKRSVGLRAKRLTVPGHKLFAALTRRMRAEGYITDGQHRHALATGDFGRPVKGYESLVDPEVDDIAILRADDDDDDAVDDANGKAPLPTVSTTPEAPPAPSVAPAPDGHAPAAPAATPEARAAPPTHSLPPPSGADAAVTTDPAAAPTDPPATMPASEERSDPEDDGA